jgi:hypothetical protein
VSEVYFMLDEQGDPLQVSDPEAWARWFEQTDRCIARTTVTGSVVVLTTFEGVDQVSAGQLPLLFGTFVFGGVLDGEEVRHATRTAALEAHARVTELCRAGTFPDYGITEEQIS